jgi:transcriptional regulator with XRE-family HTH domain
VPNSICVNLKGLANLRHYLATRLATLRASRGWAQHDLAAACGRSPSWVRGYEQQKRWPDPEDLDLLARALGVSPESLIARAPDPTPQEALEVVARELETRRETPARDPLAERVARLGPDARRALEAMLPGMESVAAGDKPRKQDGKAPDRGK